MPKFAIAFVTPAENNVLKHRILESSDKDNALKQFFADEISEFYSNDEQGFFYFKEDFYDKAASSGSIIPCD